jgi:hypothetical protein
MPEAMPAPLSAEEIADLFGETEPEPRKQLAKLAARLGAQALTALVEAVSAIEAHGGLLLPDGRRRTPGGVLFYLTRVGLYTQSRRKARPPQVPALPLAEAVPTLPHLRKGWSTMKVVLTGRPGEWLQQGEFVVVQMTSKISPSLPRGLPLPPTEGVTWTVLMARKQWQGVSSALRADRDDKLVIEGQVGRYQGDLVVFATQVVTHAQQRTRRDAQRAAALA